MDKLSSSAFLFLYLIKQAHVAVCYTCAFNKLGEYHKVCYCKLL